MRNTWWCLALRSISGKVWCPWIYRRAFRVPCSWAGVGAGLPTFVLRITDGTNNGARSWSLRVSFAEDVDKLRLGHEGLPVGEVCNIMDFFDTQTTWEVMQNHTQQSKNADFSSKRTSFDPPPSPMNIVRLKQNAGNWRRPLSKKDERMTAPSQVFCRTLSIYLSTCFSLSLSLSLTHTKSEALWARIPEIQVRIPSRAMGTFFPHTVSSIFHLSLTRLVRLSGVSCRCLASRSRR